MAGQVSSSHANHHQERFLYKLYVEYLIINYKIKQLVNHVHAHNLS